MGDNKEKRDECKMAQTDSEGNSNLCCCYIFVVVGSLNTHFLKIEGFYLKWKKKNAAGTKGAMKIRESSIHFSTKPSSMLRWLETTTGLGFILNRIDLCPQAQLL